MAETPPHPAESTPLLPDQPLHQHPVHENTPYDGDVESLLSSAISQDERAVMHATTLGERLPYNDYTTIDWLHDLVKDSVRHRHRMRRLTLISAGARPGAVRDGEAGGTIFDNSGKGGSVRVKMWESWDAAQGWVAAALIGSITACIAFVVDVSVVTVADWKEGYCRRDVLLNRGVCCRGKSEKGPQTGLEGVTGCDEWISWDGEGGSDAWAYGVYIGFALLFGLVAGAVTTTTRAHLPAVAEINPSRPTSGLGKASDKPDNDNVSLETNTTYTETPVGKMMYMAAGSGIPEIKTILSGFVIPHFLDIKVMLVKAVGATFAVSTGMCLGKEGPFVHISTCVGYMVANWFPKYKTNQRKNREMLSVACSAGLSVAFGAPIGGVLFSYEEISTYFPRKVMWRSFLCSLIAAVALKQLNPTGKGKLVLFETKYGVDYDFVHYLVFVLLGVVGGVYGGVFCKANFVWSKWFRRLPLIKNNPVFEVLLVALLTGVLQYPNRLIRDTGDVVMEKLLANCQHPEQSWLCQQETNNGSKGTYYAWLISGTLVKLLLTIVTFGCKVPSGIIIPSLDAGALFGRMVGQLVPNISPGIFAMVGSAAFLAGVSRMTVSLAVIMFELTGEVNFIPPVMVAILIAKWVADAISADGVYDLAQHLLGHPFLDPEHALDKVRGLNPNSENSGTMEDLIPPANTMEEITLRTGPDYRVIKSTLRDKLARLKTRGLMDAGLVLVNERSICHGYLPEAELEYAIGAMDETREGMGEQDEVDLLDGVISEFVDRSPLTVTTKAPVEYAVEMFGKLGLRYLIIVEEETARVVGVVIKKRLLSYLDGLR